MTIDDHDVLAPEPKARPSLVHYTDHHGGAECAVDAFAHQDILTTATPKDVTCLVCRALKGYGPIPEQVKNNSTWPPDCPTCHDRWDVKSRTMGAALGQPHRGICINGHSWREGMVATPQTLNKTKLPEFPEASARRHEELAKIQHMVALCDCQYPVVKYRNGHGHSEDCPFVLDKKARQ